MDELTITESLLLLLTKDEGDFESIMGPNAPAMRAAAVTDLVLAGNLRLDTEGRQPRVEAVPGSAPHSAVAGALERIESRRYAHQRTIKSVIGDAGLDAASDAARSLAARGVVSIVEKAKWGLVPEKRPTLDPGPERDLREGLAQVLAGAAPTPHQAAVLGILQGAGLIAAVLTDETAGLTKRQVKARIQTLPESVQAGEELRQAIAMLHTIVFTTAILPIVVGGSG